MIYYSEEPIQWSLYWAGESSQRRREANKSYNITALIMKCLWTQDKLRQLWTASLGTFSQLLSYDSCQGDFPIIKWKHLVLFSCNRIPNTNKCAEGVLLKPNRKPERNKNDPTPHWSNLAGVSHKYLVSSFQLPDLHVCFLTFLALRMCFWTNLVPFLTWNVTSL